MMNKNFLEMMRQFQTIKAVVTKCETCGGPHYFTECPAVDGYTHETAYATMGTGSLPSNIVSNPQEDLKAITTQSGVTLAGPLVYPPSPSKEVNREPKTIMDQTKPTIPYPSRVNKQKLREKDDNLALKFVEIFRNLPFELSFADALLHMPMFALMFKSLLNNKEKLFDLATTLVNENYSVVILKKLRKKVGDPDKFLIPCDFPEFDECLSLADLGASINLMPLSIWKKISLPKLTSTQLILKLADRSTTRPASIAEEGDIHLLEELLNNDPSLSPLPLKELNVEKIKTVKSFIDEPPEVELKYLSSHLEYAYLEGTNKLPVIIEKGLKVDEKEALLKVLKSHKRAIAWKITDIKGIDPRFCTNRILMEEDYKPMVQSQRRVNPKIHEVIKKEVIKLLDAIMIYPISDSLWVSPVHCVPKKDGVTIVENKNNKLIPTRLVMGWHVCIDYLKLNNATRKDHFPLPFMDQMLERLAGNEFYCFLDGFFDYF
uniref:Reverse transcriptase domain-containing protein n=1 Tax=Tanacetum cinerariifolium TaxID=118510 RepID=A0A699I3D0_TANCI|nr:reverse transcriptase domain-containing protein [Tanacetum cinerariifolium]